VAPKREFLNAPAHIEAKMRAICGALPEIVEKPTWRGTPRWQVRGNTFADLVCEVRNGVAVTFVTVRSEGADLDALLHVGHPFYPGWGGGLIAMVLDDKTDWDEAAEVLTDSYCICAPKKLQALIAGRATPPQ
jgi:hypothetical protein